MRIGTKSILFGAHCFFLHPWFVALGWWKLYGFPFDPRLWVAFAVHDFGYIGKPNMDGKEGETHVESLRQRTAFLFLKPAMNVSGIRASATVLAMTKAIALPATISTPSLANVAVICAYV